jgi:type IV pilus assembly protein PilW
MACASPGPRPAHAIAGFSLIDVMVGMVIGLVGMIVVFQSFNAFEANKRTTTQANDAQENGLMAIASIERDIRLAGYGLYYAGSPLCNGYRQWTAAGAETINAFMPAVLTNGASNGSDSITLTYSTSGFGATPAQVQTTFTGSVPEVVVDNNTGNNAFRAGEHILVGRSGLACTRLQVSSVRTDADNPQFLALRVEATNMAPANPPVGDLAALLPAGGYINTRQSLVLSAVSNMGRMRRVLYTVALDLNFGGRLQARDLTAGTPAADLADGIVNLQAQYGISAAETTQQVTDWVDASGIWANPAFQDQGRIKAIRIAVVARSQLQEKNEVQGSGTSCTNASGSSARGPCAWKDTAADPAPIIDLSGNPNWKRHRYRVYDTIVPLRNVMWQFQ